MKVPFVHRVKFWLWDLWDALFPPACVGCGARGYLFCPDCWAQVEALPERVCPRCAHPLPQNRGKPVRVHMREGVASESTGCPRCSSRPWWLTRTRAVRPYIGLWRTAIHELKYRRNWGMARLFAWEAYQALAEARWPVSCLVPVPLHEARQRERGYNQVALWAQELAWRLQLPYRPHGLRRVRPTASQVGLNWQQRWENVRNAFEARPQVVEGCRVLLVDDVLTTGATLNEAAKALLQAGAVAVYGLVLARALMSPQEDVP